MPCSSELVVGARASPLSRVQVQEIMSALPTVPYRCCYLETTGDKDQTTSLRSLERTDFFTKELDQLLLTGGCRVTFHAAKDLPHPLPEGLVIVAITKGVDPSDALLFKEPVNLVATSSERREAAVRQLFPKAKFCDLRGTIGERLLKLEKGEVDGIVVAEAALIRLGLTHLNRIKLPGETVPLQGKLAVVARSGDAAMANLFSPLNRVLETGLGAPFPFIETRALPYTHVLFTSKTAVRLLPEIPEAILIAVGEGTARALRERGFEATHIAEEECSEGVVKLLDTLDLKDAHLFWPHSAGSRDVIPHFCKARSIRLSSLILYETVPVKQTVPLDGYEAIFFTSPSTVDSFDASYGEPSKTMELHAIGPVTAEAIRSKWNRSCINSPKSSQ